MSIYREMKEAGLYVDSHESDLYVPVNYISERIVDKYQFKENVRQFCSAKDGLMWYDIPFAYDPFWEARLR